MTKSTAGSDAKLRGWFVGRLPAEWFTGEPDVTHDRDEIVVVGTLAEPEVADEGSDEGVAAAARQGRIQGFREDTRQLRMRIADEAEARYGRKVAWGIEIGAIGEDKYERILFTHIAVPVMTRLKQPERQVLDTLVDAGVARSRSDALAWSVRLVGEHADEWLGKLRDAMKNVDDLRADGPQL